MGRPWWHDSYWETKGRKPTRGRFRLPGRQSWVWIALVVLSLVLAMGSTGFHPVGIAWLLDFVSYFCRILALAVFLRAILTWFVISPNNLLVIVLINITRPLLAPLRRVVPKIGRFDITPLVAIGLLYLVPSLLSRFVR